MSKIIDKVETFIQRLQDMEYIIAPEAAQLWFWAPPSVPKVPLIYKEKKTLSDYLAGMISLYEENRDNEKKKLDYAQMCLSWINRAFACGVIREGKGLISKNKKLVRDNKRLREHLDECNKRCQKLEEEMKRIHGLFPDTGTFTGDVQDE